MGAIEDRGRTVRFHDDHHHGSRRHRRRHHRHQNQHPHPKSRRNRSGSRRRRKVCTAGDEEAMWHSMSEYNETKREVLKLQNEQDDGWIPWSPQQQQEEDSQFARIAFILNELYLSVHDFCASEKGLLEELFPVDDDLLFPGSEGDASTLDSTSDGSPEPKEVEELRDDHVRNPFGEVEPRDQHEDSPPGDNLAPLQLYRTGGDVYVSDEKGGDFVAFERNHTGHRSEAQDIQHLSVAMPPRVVSIITDDCSEVSALLTIPMSPSDGGENRMFSPLDSASLGPGEGMEMTYESSKSRDHKSTSPLDSPPWGSLGTGEGMEMTYESSRPQHRSSKKGARVKPRKIRSSKGSRKANADSAEVFHPVQISWGPLELKSYIPGPEGCHCGNNDDVDLNSTQNNEEGDHNEAKRNHKNGKKKAFLEHTTDLKEKLRNASKQASKQAEHYMKRLTSWTCSEDSEVIRNVRVVVTFGSEH